MSIEKEKVTLGRFDADDDEGETTISIKTTTAKFLKALDKKKEEVTTVTKFFKYVHCC